MNTTFRRQGDPVQCGWSIGRAPLALRGIRLIEGENGGAPAGQGDGQQPAGGENPPAPSPAQLAAFYASQNGGQTPPASPAPPAPAPQQIQGFTPEQVQKLMAQNSELQKQFEQTQKERDEAQKERNEFHAQIAEHAREKAVTAAAAGKANTALLLDSAKFQATVKDIDVADTEKLGAVVEQFVKDYPAYAATAPAPPLPNTSGGTPAGGTTSKPTTLQGAVAARLSS